VCAGVTVRSAPGAGGHESLGEQGDIEAQAPGPQVNGFFIRDEQVDKEDGEPRRVDRLAT
jgi:hypothetical protein